MRLLFLLLKIALVLGLLAAAAIGVYLYILDGEIRERFDGGRWDRPATVYGQPAELYTGARLKLDDLEAELTQLGYRQRANVRRAGTFQRVGNRLIVHLRAFRFMERQRDAEIVEIAFRDDRIDVIQGRGPDRRIDLIRLDPPQIGSFFPNQGEDRLVLPPSDVPALLREGLKAVEDQNFDNHPGFDIRGIARAFWVNISSGELRQGGSTLTQQLVKSYFLSNERTLKRKLRELAMSVILDARYSKADLINAYINEIYLAQDGNRAVHGFGLGAQYYFNQPLQELAPHQIALLIGVIRGPSYYNPRRHTERALERRNLVLDLMHGRDLLTLEERDAARAEPLGVTESSIGGTYQPSFMDLVRDQLATSYSTDSLSGEGLRVFTTLNARIQRAANGGVERALSAIEQRRELEPGSLQASVVVSSAQTGDILAVVGGRNSSYNRALNARRQIGSLFKPVVYLAAIESDRYHLASPIWDEPVSVPTGRNKPDWQPKNFDDKPRGQVPLFRALADSLNLATVRLGLDLGVESIAERYAALTGEPAPTPYPSLLLGAIDLSPLQVTRLYANFAGGGFAANPHPVTAVLTADNATVDGYPLDIDQSIGLDDADALAAAMMVAMSHGTGRSSPFSRSGMAGKTGTSDDNRDSWFVGYDSRHLFVVWVGRDDNAPTGLTGGSGALVVFNEIAREIGIEPLIEPVGEPVDAITGELSHRDCGDVVFLPLPPKTALPAKPGCGNLGDSVTERVQQWWQRRP